MTLHKAVSHVLGKSAWELLRKELAVVDKTLVKKIFGLVSSVANGHAREVKKDKK